MNFTLHGSFDFSSILSLLAYGLIAESKYVQVYIEVKFVIKSLYTMR